MMDWDNEWMMARERSPLKITSQNRERWRAFWSKDANSYLEDVKKEAAYYERIVERIQNEGWIERTDEVLDIGSGPGTFALPLASHVRSVTALDEAPGMLEVLEEECRARSIENIETKLCSWEEFDGSRSYDLAFTALSPAIRSRKDLLAMEKASRSRCCLVTSCPSDWMSLRNDLWEKVIGKFVPSDASSIRYPLNVLLDEGRSPILLKFEDKIETKSPSQNVIDHYLDYFQIFTDMTQEKVNIVREHILSQTTDGYVISRGTRCLHLLFWKCK